MTYSRVMYVPPQHCYLALFLHSWSVPGPSAQQCGMCHGTVARAEKVNYLDNASGFHTQTTMLLGGGRCCNKMLLRRISVSRPLMPTCTSVHQGATATLLTGRNTV